MMFSLSHMDHTQLQPHTEAEAPAGHVRGLTEEHTDLHKGDAHLSHSLHNHGHSMWERCPVITQRVQLQAKGYLRRGREKGSHLLILPGSAGLGWNSRIASCWLSFTRKMPQARFCPAGAWEGRVIATLGFLLIWGNSYYSQFMFLIKKGRASIRQTSCWCIIINTTRTREQIAVRPFCLDGWDSWGCKGFCKGPPVQHAAGHT